eukprot:TRINITY_DN22121_c0_g1_i1.p3 TRINITY_DN22121_c0_g1~~TRINITY_DN22121_c0_g1_i1.p3  ORF type:complete len:251 (+),score=121.45 TRINITY_DN22121_c0_g1_i1:46-798(+)
MSRFTLAQTPEMEFVTLCKQGDFEAVAARLEGGENPNTKAYVYWKNRLIGFKSCKDWGIMTTHQSQDRMMGSAAHYAAFGKKAEVLGLLLAFGASGDERMGYPPHMPAELSVAELAKEVEAKAEDAAREDAASAPAAVQMSPLFLFFRLWNNLPLDSPKKMVLLEKLPPSCTATLKPYLAALVQRHVADPTLAILCKGQAAAKAAPKTSPEEELAKLYKDEGLDMQLDMDALAKEVAQNGRAEARAAVQP